MCLQAYAWYPNTEKRNILPFPAHRCFTSYINYLYTLFFLLWWSIKIDTGGILVRPLYNTTLYLLSRYLFIFERKIRYGFPLWKPGWFILVRVTRLLELLRWPTRLSQRWSLGSNCWPYLGEQLAWESTKNTHHNTHSSSRIHPVINYEAQ